MSLAVSFDSSTGMPNSGVSAQSPSSSLRSASTKRAISSSSTNLPYTPGIFAAFNHHLSEIKRFGKHFENYIIDPLAPSAARVIYDYFGGKKRFPDISVDMMDAVDNGESVQFN